MARNSAQFHKGIGLSRFLRECGTEGQCFDALRRWRWPDGFRRPHCGHDKHRDQAHREPKRRNRYRRQTSITSRTIFDFSKPLFNTPSEGGTVISDGLTCFNSVTGADKIVCGGGRASVDAPEFHWVNTVLGNLKSALRSTHHAIRPKYAQRYPVEFQCRCNRRFDFCALIPRLAYVSSDSINAGKIAETWLSIGGS